MDTRVKERLVGAAVLVGIIVALVPEMLSGPRQSSTGPAADDQVRTYTIDLSREAGAGGPPREVIPGDAPVVTPAPPPEAGSPEASEAEPGDVASTGSAADASQLEPVTQSSLPPEATVATQVRPEATTPQVRAATPAPPPQVGTPGDSGWAVQLGSFARPDNAERLANDLRKSGYRAFVSRVGSGTSQRHRVRVGPEEDRSKAEALAQRLRREGRQASIVEHP